MSEKKFIAVNARLPAPLVKTLKARAAKNLRSLTSEIRDVLQKDVDAKQ